MTALPPLVGLIGKKRVGKDTFAAVLVEEFGFARVAFADPLKEMALTIDPVIDVAYAPERLTSMVERLGWEDAKDWHDDVRRFLQRLGDGVRQFDPEFWVRAGMTSARDIRMGDAWIAGQGGELVGEVGKPVVITDVRYPNEADAIREAGGTLVRIVRPGVDDGDTHASETALDGYDLSEREGWKVPNDAGLDKLRLWARVIAQHELDFAGA